MTQTIGIDATFRPELAIAMKSYGQELILASRRTEDFDTADMLYTIGIQYVRDGEALSVAPYIGSGALVAVERTVLDMAHTALVEMSAMAQEDAQSLRDQAFAKDFQAARMTLIAERLGL